jgi:hypothetical protein
LSDPNLPHAAFYSKPGNGSWTLRPDNTGFIEGDLIGTVDPDPSKQRVHFRATWDSCPAALGSVALAASTTAGQNGRSQFAASLIDPTDVSSDRRLLATNGFAAFLVALLIVFPSNLFNSTLAANYEEVMGWFRPARRIFAVTGGAARRLPERVKVAAFLVAGTIIVGSLDPDFGLNAHSIPIGVGMLMALTAGALLTGRLAAIYAQWRYRVGYHVRVYPGGLVVAVACVVLSRGVSFLPGYLYGLITVADVEHQLEPTAEARAICAGMVGVLLISLAAWTLRLPVKAALNGGPLPGLASVPLSTLDVLFTALMVGGIQGMLFGLIPIRFQPGYKLRRWKSPTSPSLTPKPG